MRPFKQCSCGVWCATGYCVDCRRKDELAKAEAQLRKAKAKLRKDQLCKP